MGKRLVPLGERKTDALWVKGNCCQATMGPEVPGYVPPSSLLCKT